MKKSLLALAVLGAFAGAAQAQSSVTLYGIVDGGVLYQSNQGAAANGGGNFLGFGSGIEATNRWGIRGSEDLGGGLSATFALENGFTLGSGIAGQTGVNGRLFDRGATVGLKGGFGSVDLGRNWSPFVLSMIAHDSNGFSNFGSLNWVSFAGAGAGNIVNRLYWVDNSIVYKTPNISGFSGSLLYGFGNVAGDNSAGRQIALNGVYANGPLTVSAGYQDARTGTVNASTSDLRAWNIGGKYNFGVATAHVAYSDFKDPSVANAFRRNVWSIGASMPFGGNMIGYANWIRLKDKNVNDANTNLFKFAVDYNFSKTTTAYVNLGFTRNDANAARGVTLASGATRAGDNVTALGVGLRKAF